MKIIKLYVTFCFLFQILAAGLAEAESLAEKISSQEQQVIKQEKQEPTISASATSKLIKLIYANAKDITNMLTSLIPEVKNYADERLNTVILSGNAQKIEEAEKIIKEADMGADLVLCEIVAAEVSWSKNRDINWEFTNYSLSLDSIYQAGTLSTSSLPKLLPGLLHFRGENAEVKILATPKIMTLSKVLAKVYIGDKIPIPITSSSFVAGQVTSSTSIQFEEVGIKLEITPETHPNGDVTLLIKVEVSTLGKTTAQGYPEIGTRNAETKIRIKDGETAIIGGLMKETIQETRTGLPFLMDIPLIGPIFSKTSYKKTITEIKISITPHIIKPGGVSDSIRKEEKETEKKDEPYLEGGINIGGVFPLGNLEKLLDAGYAVGGNLILNSVLSASEFGFEFDIKYCYLKGSNNQLSIIPITLSGVYNLSREKLRPYIKFGGGVAYSDTTKTTDGLINFGLGVGYKIREDTILRIGIDYDIIFRKYFEYSDEKTSIIFLNIGLDYSM